MIDFKTMKKKDLEHYLFIGNQFYDSASITPETKLDIENARIELERRQVKKGTPVSPAQKKVLDFIKAHRNESGEVSLSTLEREFNARVIENCTLKGLIEVISKSRLRQDDQEMVYWSVYVLVPSKLEKSLS